MVDKQGGNKYFPKPEESKMNWRNQQQGNQQTNYQNTKPNPRRFEQFELNKDQTGFYIPNCDFLFEFDQYGGWFDEFDNYYDENGKPCQPPYDEEDDYDDNFDKFVDEYDNDGGDDYADQQDDIYQKAENTRYLELYNDKQDVDVEVSNINWKFSDDQFDDLLAKNKVEYIQFEYEYDERNRFIGKAYVTVNKANALKLFDLHGHSIMGRNIKVRTLKPENNGPAEDHDAHDDHDDN